MRTRATTSGAPLSRNRILNDSTPSATTPEAEWIGTREALDNWLSGVDGLLAVDTEFMRRNTFHAQLALLQFAHDGRYALVDPLAVPLDGSLADMDRERAPTWIMHSPSEDLDVLAPLLPEGPARLFDTQLAAAFCGMGLGISYRALVETVTGVQLDKGETRSDWMQRPLTDSAAPVRHAGRGLPARHPRTPAPRTARTRPHGLVRT